MWDVMTLYDSHKKRVEDKIAFNVRKEKQREIREFYDKQINYKRALRMKELEDQRQDLRDVKEHVGILNDFQK